MDRTVRGLYDPEIEKVVYGLVIDIEHSIQKDSLAATFAAPRPIVVIPSDDIDAEIRNECSIVLLETVECVIGANELEGLRYSSTGGSQVSLGDFAMSSAAGAGSENQKEDCTNVVSRGNSQLEKMVVDDQAASSFNTVPSPTRVDVDATSSSCQQVSIIPASALAENEDEIVAVARDSVKLSTPLKVASGHAQVMPAKTVVDIPADDDEMDIQQEQHPNTKSNAVQDLQMSDEEVDEVYHALWLSRKKELETRAEERAKLTYLSWQRDRKSLEDIIEGSLKEYIDIYEKAHALRLQFEAERQQLMSTVNAMLAARGPMTASPASSYFPSSKPYRLLDKCYLNICECD